MLLLAAAAAPATAMSDWTPIEQAVATPAFGGIWKSKGYGYLLVIDGGRAQLFHHAGRYCYPEPGAVVKRDGLQLVRRASHTELATTAAPGETRYLFQRTAALPADCAASRHRSREEIARIVASTFGELYPAFGRRGRNRSRLSAALTGGGDNIADDAQLHAQLVDALRTLEDAHVGLTATLDGKDRSFEGGEAPTLEAVHVDARFGMTPALREREWSRRYRQGLVALLDRGGHHVANRRVLWGRIGQVGYINIVTMGGFADDDEGDDRSVAALDAALDDALADFANLPAVIVDVTNNRGGHDGIGLRIAGRFADRPRLAYSKRGFGGRARWQAFDVVPSSRGRYLGPVALLTSDITVSAAETFTLAMRALPNVTQVGARTRGALSDQLAKPLPNGWTLTLPAETYLDQSGRDLEGIGIEAEIARLPFAPSHGAFVASIARDLSNGHLLHQTR